MLPDAPVRVLSYDTVPEIVVDVTDEILTETLVPPPPPDDATVPEYVDEYIVPPLLYATILKLYVCPAVVGVPVIAPEELLIVNPCTQYELGLAPFPELTYSQVYDAPLVADTESEYEDPEVNEFTIEESVHTGGFDGGVYEYVTYDTAPPNSRSEPDVGSCEATVPLFPEFAPEEVVDVDPTVRPAEVIVDCAVDASRPVIDGTIILDDDDESMIDPSIIHL
jgi:hypothetical protein